MLDKTRMKVVKLGMLRDRDDEDSLCYNGVEILEANQLLEELDIAAMDAPSAPRDGEAVEPLAEWTDQDFLENRELLANLKSCDDYAVPIERAVAIIEQIDSYLDRAEQAEGDEHVDYNVYEYMCLKITKHVIAAKLYLLYVPNANRR